jgi:membrane peptidoglycan carboxypeptidase
VSLFLLLSGIALSFFYVTLTRDLPSLEIFPLNLEPPNGILLQPTVLYDRKGENILLRLRNPAAEDAGYLSVNLEASAGAEFFSKELIKATISNLDPDFWDTEKTPFGWLLKPDENKLAQQLVSRIILWDEPEGILHDLRIRLLASQAIDRFGGKKVLEWYLNSAKFGDFVYGADAAALVYLGKSASGLNLAEGALIAAIASTPDINPHSVPILALDRQKELIQGMLEQGLISRDEARKASQEVVKIRDQVNLQDDFRPFTSFVLDQLTSIMPRDRLEQGGINIITSMDFDLQIQAQCALQVYVKGNGNRQLDIPAIDGSPCEATRLLPTLLVGADEFPERLKAATAISDPKTGQLLALVSESDADEELAGSLNFPAGTVLTPYIYLTAFTRGFNPGTMVWDVPGLVESEEIEIHTSGFEELINSIEPYHGPIRLRTSLANDYLRPAFMLMDQISSANVIRTLARFGLVSQDSASISSNAEEKLFKDDIGLIDVIQAYGTLANHGVLAGQELENDTQHQDQPIVGLSGVLRLEDASGNMLLDWSSPQSSSIVSNQLAYLMTHILSDEAARWETLGHPNPLEIGRPAAVKLSHTLDENGSWVIGFDPDRVVGVWVESLEDDHTPLIQQLSAGLWHAIIQYTLQGEPPLAWEVPPGISTIDVCDPSGMLPTSNCPFVVTETFLSGQEPTHFDTLYRLFQINRETGNLANIFTPTELIEERVYLVVPPQAEEWARSENLPLPPENYDAIAVPSNASSDVMLDSPEMFSHVRGVLSIRGSAGGEGFSYYRLQAGQGLNPGEWVQIGEDIKKPVKDDVLMKWDTKGLTGLYALKLLVVHQDQRVEKAILQVTIDNQKPEITILSPVNEQSYSAKENEVMILRADAIDDLEVGEVKFILDDQLLRTLTQIPYIVSWVPRIGEHKLLVQAEDLAGNISQEWIVFSIDR